MGSRTLHNSTLTWCSRVVHPCPLATNIKVSALWRPSANKTPSSSCNPPHKTVSLRSNNWLSQCSHSLKSTSSLSNRSSMAYHRIEPLWSLSKAQTKSDPTPPLGKWLENNVHQTKALQLITPCTLITMQTTQTWAQLKAQQSQLSTWGQKLTKTASASGLLAKSAISRIRCLTISR